VTHMGDFLFVALAFVSFALVAGFLLGLEKI
jgi:hypothetical protein